VKEWWLNGTHRARPWLLLRLLSWHTLSSLGVVNELSWRFSSRHGANVDDSWFDAFSGTLILQFVGKCVEKVGDRNNNSKFTRESSSQLFRKEGKCLLCDAGTFLTCKSEQHSTYGRTFLLRFFVLVRKDPGWNNSRRDNSLWSTLLAREATKTTLL
jgi:hypothetical protein